MDHLKKPTWDNRRKIIFCIVRHCVGHIWAILILTTLLSYFDKIDSWTAGVIFLTCLIAQAALLVMTVGSYVFGAVWDDSNYMKLLSDLKGGALDAIRSIGHKAGDPGAGGAGGSNDRRVDNPDAPTTGAVN